MLPVLMKTRRFMRIVISATSTYALVALALLPAFGNAQTFVRIETAYGNIDIELFDTVATKTVENFLNYVQGGDYDGTFIHRIESGFVLQAGGYIFNPEDGGFSQGGTSHIPTDLPVANEFNLSNVRATVAMAKSSDPDSATSEWFINLADNSAALDNPLNLGGFTVFGEVTPDGMRVVDQLATIPTFVFAPNPVYNFPGFNNLPLFNFPSGLPVQTSNLVLLNKVSVLQQDTDMDGIVDSEENAAPNSGDGNNDGIPDREQSNVASFTDTYGSLMSIVAPASTTLSSVTVLDENFLTTDIQAVGGIFDGINLGHGFLSFLVKGFAPGGAVNIDLIVHTGALPDSYYKYGPTPQNPVKHWYRFDYDPETGTGANVNGNVVSLSLVDGGRGDGDLSPDGEIYDPGAVATNVAIAGSSGNSGGGCTISTLSNGQKNGGEWLILLILGFWLRAYRRVENRRKTGCLSRSSVQLTIPGMGGSR
jgi:peptidyl-prolyl cis-trans isomerase A (cyclophilin A)